MRLVLSDHNIYEYIDTSTSFRLVTTLCVIIAHFIYIYIYIYIYGCVPMGGHLYIYDDAPSFITRFTGCWGGGGGGVCHSHDLSRSTSTLNTVDSAHRLFTSRFWFQCGNLPYKVATNWLFVWCDAADKQVWKSRFRL